MADTPTGETVTPEAPSNNAVPVATPAVNAPDPAEVERLRKEREQAQMRANQLENELKKIREQEEAARLKQLEEQNEWKAIAEQNAAKLEALTQERDAAEQKAALEAATAQVLSKYPENVTDLARDMGLALSDASEAGQAALAAKLDKIAEKVAASTRPGANNPGNAPSQTTPLSGDEMKMALKTEAGFNAQISQLPTVAAMMTPRNNG